MRQETPRPSTLSLAIPALLAALSFGCSSSTPKPADGPSGSTDPTSSDDPAAKDAKPDDAPKQEGPSSGAKSGEGKRDETIPDDYSLTESDCDALGKQYGEVAKSDQMAGVSSKLTDKQKEKAEESVDKVVSKMASQWIESCQQSLAGKIVDRRVLKCAMNSKTVAEFKTCIGDDSKPGAANKPASKPGKK